MLYIYEDHTGGIYGSDHDLSWWELYCEECYDSDTFIGEYDRSDHSAIWNAIYPPEKDEDQYYPSIHIIDAMEFMYNYVPDPSPTYIIPLYMSEKGNMLVYSDGWLIRYYCYDPDKNADELITTSISPSGGTPNFLASWITESGTNILLYTVRSENPVMMLNNRVVCYVDPREFTPRKEDEVLWETIMEVLNGAE